MTAPGATCTPMPPPRPAVPDTVLGQAIYMAELSEQLQRWQSGQPPSAKVLADICHAIAVLALAIASDGEAYCQGVADGTAGRAHAAALAEGGA